MTDFERGEAQVGETNQTIEEFRIETGKVAEFARAICDPSPVYRDAQAAQDAGFDRIPAPPTFTRVSSFPRYRRSGIGPEFGFDLGFQREYVLHGEQRYRYERPLFVGDELVGETTLEDVFQRDGQNGGTMTFAIFRTDFYNAESGTLLQSVWNTRIETDGPPTETEEPPESEIDPSGEEFGVAVGAVDSTVETPPLERRDFVRYAGASGDFNPIHYDEPLATGAGHSSVFAQGMFSAGVASRLLRTWLGINRLETYRTRFTSRAYPGDVLSVRGRVTDTTEVTKGRRTTISLEVVAGDNRKIAAGEATAVVDHSPR